MANRRTATAATVEETPEAFPTPETNERPRGRGNYSDSKPIELVIDSVDRPYAEAVTEGQRELLARFGITPA